MSEVREFSNQVPAVERTFAILDILGERGQASLPDIVEASGFNKSTVYYTLRTLAAREIVEYDDATRVYALGTGLMRLGLAAGARFGDVDIAKRVIQPLLEDFAVTLVVYRRVNLNEIMMVDKVERPHRVRITLEAHNHVPIQGASFGRVFLAYDSPKDVDEALRDGLHRFTDKSVTSVAEFRRDLQRTRERGWAVDHEGFALGVSTVAAPIFDAHRRLALVAGTVGFTSVLSGTAAERLGGELRAACDRVSALLGGPGTGPT